MPPPAPEFWKRVEALYHAAAERDVSQRAAFLQSACDGDEALRREVESLLAQPASQTGILDARRLRRIGDYELRGLLGVGGMGEVYRAHDVRLRRDVALKLLPHKVTSDPDRRARFEREARALAALNHPNIAIIHGVESAGDARAIVMELVDGETLAERIERSGRLSVTDAIAIARQIAHALDAAHEKGIVHRDLKPANIKVTSDGVVKVLDFGLATPFGDAGPSDAPATGLPTTAAAAATREGLILGTAAYMSPEQARGQTVDKRTDIWAFGCVLFEMLSGRSPFAGPTTTDTMAAVLERDPPWEAVTTAPPHLRRLLERCLEKNLKRRQRDIADAARDLDPPDEPATPPRGRKAPVLPWAITVAAVLGAAGAWWTSARVEPAVASAGLTLTRLTWERGLAIEPALSPDGSLVVYASDSAGDGNLDLWLQRVAGGAPVRLTEDAADDREPVFSPDGVSIAFRSERAGGGVYVMPALGGDARLIAASGRHPQYSPDGGRIAYWTGTPLGGARNRGTAVFTVAANGGTPQRLAEDFVSARTPVWSPDGKSLIFFGRQSAAPPATAPNDPNLAQPVEVEFDWWWVRLTGGEPVATGAYPAFTAKGIAFLPAAEIDSLPGVWTTDGVLFSATLGQATNLWRIRISQTTGSTEGEPERLTTGAGTDGSPTQDRLGRIAFQVSESAESIFLLRLEANAGKSLQTIDRLTTDWDLSAHRGSVSQDGRILAYPRHRPNASELWVRDLVSGRDRHLVTTVRTQQNPTISADGQRVAYTVAENGRNSGHVVGSAGGVPRKVCDDCAVQGWLADGRRVLVVRAQSPRVRLLDVDTGAPRDVFDVAESVQRAFASSDDRWVVAAVADKAWVMPFPSDRMATPATAQEVRLPAGALAGRVCGWSPDNRLLYSLLVLDGFRCLYAQRIDPASGTAAEPFAVHHFHDPRRAWGSTPMGNAVTTRGLVFDQLETLSSIWMLDQGVAK